MTTDAKLAEELADLARHFLLWLQENELPQIPGLGGEKFDQFEFYAGVFQHYNGEKYICPTFLVEADQAERDRISRFSLGVRDMLVVTNPQEEVAWDRGESFTANRIRRKPQEALTKPGSLYVETPRLSSLRVDDKTLSLYTFRDFSSIRHKVDLVWDDKATAERAGFKYLSLFDQYTVPRTAFKQNVADVPVPVEVPIVGGRIDLRNRNAGEARIAKRIRAYRTHVLNRGTYNAKGDYYAKWEYNPAKSPDQRKFQPTNLSAKYLLANFDTNEPMPGDDMLLIDLGPAFFLYRLFWDPGKGKPNAKFMVEGQLRSISERLPKWPPRDIKKIFDHAIPAYVFRALTGGKTRPNQVDVFRLSRSENTERFVVNYRAYVEWYYGDLLSSVPALKLDEIYRDRFIRTFFPDQTYTLTLPKGHGINREDLFLNALRQQEKDTAEGPLREPLTKLLEWCKDESHFVFTQGARMGQLDSEIIGVTPGGTEIYEWNPKTGLITRTLTRAWMLQYAHGRMSRDIYASTAGVMPLVGVMFAAALVGPVTLAALPAVSTLTLGGLARSAAVKLIKDKLEENVSREAIRHFALQIRVMGLELVLRFLPDWQHPLYRFFRGVVSGFGGGALDHWLSEVDDRLVRQIPKLPMAALYAVSPGAHRAYKIYIILDKVSAAAIRVSALHDSIKTVNTNDLVQQVAGQLRKFAKGVAIAFLILLVIGLYFYEMSDSRAEAQRLKVKNWVKRQQETLQIVIKETTNELSRYANKLRALIAKVRAKRVDPADVPSHDELAKELNAADEELSAAIKSKLGSMAGKLTGAADFLALIFEHLGIGSWQDLHKLGFMEILAKGADALDDLPALSGDAVEKLAEGLGELISTILLEKKLVPDSVRKTSGLFGKPTSKVRKGAVAGGTPRAILEFLTHPFDDLSRAPATLKAAIEKTAPPMSAYKPDANRIRDFARDLMRHDGSLSHRLMLLAEDEKLFKELQTLATSAASKPPPIFKDLAGDNAEWPGNAVAFVLFSWIRVAIRELAGMVVVLEERSPFKGKLNLGTLFQIVGLDIDLDDPVVEALRAKFTAAVQ